MKRVFKYIKEHKLLLGMIITLALPAIGEMSLNTLLGVADTLMISHFVGTEALAGVGFANQIVFTFIFVFSAFNTGATAMIARYYGEKDYKKLNSVAGQTATINILIGIITTILAIIFARQIFGIYEMSEVVLNYALEYFRIIVVGMIAMFLSFSGAAILRGAGDTVNPMIITGVANILNIIGNYVLIIGVGPFPEMGISGAAWATTISRFIGLILYVIILLNPKGKVHIRRNDLKITKNILKPLWKISYPGAVEQALMQFSFVIVGIIISQLDTITEAAFRILINIESISFMPGIGLSIASATLVGKALGEKDIEKAVSTGYIASFLSVVWGIVIGSIFLIFPKYLIGIFTPDIRIVAISITIMIIMGINQPFMNFMIVISGALRGAGDTRNIMIINSTRLWIMLLPLSYLFIIELNYGLKGFWLSELFTFIIFCAILFIRFKNRKWTRIRID